MLLLAALGPAQAQFAINSPTTSWVPVPYAAGAIGDNNVDSANGSGEVDIVGGKNTTTGPTLPSFYTKYVPGVSATAGTLYFRIRMGGDQSPAGFKGVTLVGIDANRDGKLDLFLGADTTTTDRLCIWRGTAGNALLSPATTLIDSKKPVKRYTPVAGTTYHWAAVTAASGTAGVALDPGATTTATQDFNSATGTDYFLSFSIPFGDLVAAFSSLGIAFDANSVGCYVMGSASQATSFNQDLHGVQGSIGSSTTWASLGVLSQPITPAGTIVNSAPVNTVPGAKTANGSLAVTGVSVSDADGNLATVQVTATNGVLDVSLTGGAKIVAGAAASATLTLGGTQTQINAALGTLSYVPTTAYSGSATITILSKDSSAASDSDAIAITVTSTVNRPPVAANDTAATHSGLAVTVPVTANDSDPDGNVLTITAATLSSGAGTVSSSGGNVTYTPTTVFTGTATISYTISDGQGGTASATLTVSVAPNSVPVAVNDAVNVSPSSTTLIEVLANDSDADGDPLTITSATRTSGSGTVSIVANTVQFVAPNTFGTATISYAISDGSGGTASATVTVTIDGNLPPVAQNDTAAATSGTAVLIDVLVNDSDPNADPLTITDATLTSGQGTALALNGKVQYTPPSGFTGTAAISYSIEDGRGGVASASVTVTVTAPPNAAPAIGAIPPKSLTAGQTLTFTVTATDTDAGQTLTLQPGTGGLPTGATFPVVSGPSSSGVTGTFTWTPTAVQVGTTTVTFRVTDSGSPTLSTEASVTITVAANQSPVLATIGGKSVANGATLTFTVSASDPDAGQTLAFSATNLPAGASFNAATRTFSWTPGAAQYDQVFGGITFRVTDNGAPNLSAEETISIAVGSANVAPEIGALTARTVRAGEPLTFTVTATDANAAQTISLAAVAGSLPAGASFPPASGASSQPLSSTFSWTPTAAQVGTVTVAFRTTDSGSPALSSDASVQIVVTANRAPVLTAIGDKSVITGATLTFSVSASDPDAGQTLTFSAASLPAGASFDAATRTFSWAPGAAQSDRVFSGITFRVTDNGAPNLSAEEAISIAVSSPNVAPEIGALTPRTVRAGEPLSFTVTATDANAAQTISLTAVVGSLPTGASFPPASGASSQPVSSTFSWTPTEAQVGTVTVAFRATDSASPELSSDEGVQIVVIANEAPALTAIRDKSVANGATLTFTVSASDPDAGQTLTFSATNLPAGASFDAATRTFSWTPAASQYDRVFSGLNFHVTDDGTPNLGDEETIAIAIGSANVAPEIDELAPRTARAGELHTFTVTATDANAAQTISLAAVAGSLPAGASFASASGPSSQPLSSTFSWTPTEAEIGTTVTVYFRVIDNASPPLATEASVQIIVTENQLPVLTAIHDKSVANGATLTFSVSASDPDAGQTLTFSATNLPAGASFDAATRTFSWTPGAAQYDQVFSGINFRVTDNGAPNLSDEEPIAIAVGSANVAPEIDELTPRTVQAGEPLTFTVTASDASMAQTLSLAVVVGSLPAGASFPPASGASSQPLTSTFSWTPTTAQVGTATVTFRTADNASPPLSTEVSLQIVVTASNRAPHAAADSAATLPSTPESIRVLDNDSDPDGDFFQLSETSTPSHGTAALNGDGTVTYTPEAGFTGSDSFTYTIADSNGGTGSALVTVTVANREPVALNDTFALGTGSLDVLANDSDPEGHGLEIAAFTQGSAGTVALAAAGGALIYTPGAGFSVSDSFTYTIGDGHGGAATATVTVRNDRPTARNDSALTTGAPVTLNVLANDTDANGDVLRITSFTQGLAGSVRQNPDGTLTYTPGPAFGVPDIFKVTIGDGRGGVATSFAVVRGDPVQTPSPLYDGLLIDPATGAAADGYITLRVTRTGSFTGKLSSAGRAVSLRGQFDAQGSFAATRPRGDGVTLVIALQCEPGDRRIVGTMSDGTATTAILASACPWAVKHSVSPGFYTILLPPAPGENTAAGTGFALMRMNSAGAVRIVGRTPDGSRFSSQTNLDADGVTFEIYAGLYPKLTRGSLFGKMAFGEMPEVCDMQGALHWHKPPQAAGQVTLDTTLDAIAARYRPPLAGSRVLNLSQTIPNAVLEMEGAGIAAISQPLAIASNSAVTVADSNARLISLTIRPSSGLFYGFYSRTGGLPQRLIFGVIYQKQNLGGGLFFGTSGTGSATISPP